MSDLAKRAVACPGWRWLPGMVDEDGDRVIRVDPDGTVLWLGRTSRVPFRLHPRGQILPDLTDPGTIGCLTALVREAWAPCEAWADEPLSAFAVNGAWGVGYMDDGAMAAAVLPALDTETEALVAALKAAPNNTTKGE